MKLKSILIISLLIIATFTTIPFIPGASAITYYWTDFCETLDDWVIVIEQGDISISTDAEQGSGSIDITAATENNQNVMYATDFNVPTMDPYEYWFGGYLKVVSLGSSTAQNSQPLYGIAYSIIAGAQDWITVQKSGAGFKMAHAEGADVTVIGDTVYSLNTWYKVDTNFTVATMTTYVNDVVEITENNARTNSKPVAFFVRNAVGGGLTPPNQARFDYFYIADEKREETFSDLTITVTNMEGCGNWLFAEERYYNFEANVTLFDASLDTLQVKFTDEGGNVLQWFYKNSTVDYVGIAEGSNDFMRLRDIVNGDVIHDESTISVTFKVYLTNKIMDTADVNLWMKANATTGEETDWELVGANYFHIYSIGGFSFSTNSTGNAGRITGGDVFDFYAENGSSIQSEIIFRDLQHIKIAPSFFFEPLSEVVNPAFHVTYRFDYCGADDEGWVTGFGVTLFPVVAITGTGPGAERHIIYNVTLHNRGEIIESINMSTYIRYTGSDPGLEGESKVFFDLWFNKVNASSTVGVRVNAYEYPMIESAFSWIAWLQGATWSPNEGLRKDVMLFAPLLDAANETLYAPEIKLIRVYVNLTQTDLGDYFRTEIRDYSIWDLTFDQADPFNGVQTPPMDDTKVPFIYGGGLLGSLWSALSGLWTGIFGPVLLTFWDVFVGFLDTIAAALGAPHFFSNLFTWIGESLEFMVTGAEYLMTIMGSLFTLLGSLLGAFLTTMGDLITSAVTTITMFTDMMAGGYGVGADLFETFQIMTWLQVAIIFYPLYLVILWDQKGMDAVIKQLSMMFGILFWLFGFFVTVIMFTINLITSFIEAIPLAE